eukprot:jgi/Tetstr1/441581/TSEL_029809.t1
MNRSHVTPSAKPHTYVIDEPEAVAPWAASLRSRLHEAFGSDELGQRALDLLLSSSLTAQTLKRYAGILSQFAQFFHDSENISPLEATTATVFDFRALMASVVNVMFFARGLTTGVSCRVRDVRVDDYDINCSSHSLRNGAASAVNAIGVPLSHIRYQGGWATNSDVVLNYIDPNVLPSPGAWLFSGHYIAPLPNF